MKRFLLFCCWYFFVSVTSIAEVRLTDYDNKPIAPAAVYEEAHAGKCDSDSVKKRARWLSSGVEKKRLDNDWKKYKLQASVARKKIVTGYDDLGRELYILEETPTEYTREAYRLEELQWERSGDSIHNILAPLGIIGSTLLFK